METAEMEAELAKMGVRPADLETALVAVSRVRDAAPIWTSAQCVEFVGTTAAIGNLTGPNLLLISNIARIAVR